MGIQKKLNLNDIVGVLKDKASISKAILLSKPSTSPLHLAVLRATSHQTNPPHIIHISTVLSYGQGSRNTASTCIKAVINRLHNTQNSFVAFKCLIIVHCIINRGSFILQDQLSVYPFLRGKNYLNLSNFHDDSNTERFHLCFWVRWYGRFLETLLFKCKKLGFFLYSSETQRKSVSSLLNKDLVSELDVFMSIIEEICRIPELLNVEGKELIYESMSLLKEDKSCTQNEILIRVTEVSVRIGSLSFADSVELIYMLKRYQSCKEKLLLLFLNKENSVGDRLWGLVEELKEKIEESIECGERRVGVSESARFGERGLRVADSVRFGSDRFSLGRLSLPTLRNDKMDKKLSIINTN